MIPVGMPRLKFYMQRNLIHNSYQGTRIDEVITIQKGPTSKTEELCGTKESMEIIDRIIGKRMACGQEGISL